MANKKANKFMWFLIVIMAIVGISTCTSCKKENSLSNLSAKIVTRDSINVKIQSVDLDGSLGDSPQIHWVN